MNLESYASQISGYPSARRTSPKKTRRVESFIASDQKTPRPSAAPVCRRQSAGRSGIVESQGYSLGVIGTPRDRADWALDQADRMFQGIRRLASDPVGVVSNWWRDFTGDDPKAIREAMAQGAGLALDITGRAAGGRFPKFHAEVDTATFSHLSPGGGLMTHENAGGHLLEKHVGKSASNLAERFDVEPHTARSSSFYDRATAERAASEMLDLNSSKIADWLRSSDERLVIDHSFTAPVGISLARNATGAIEVSSARLVLSRAPNLPAGYLILTGFPNRR